MDKIIGNIHTVGDNIDTDQIYPGRHLDLTDPKDIAVHCLEGVDSDFYNRIKKGDIIIAGKNFGCGSSREHAVIALVNAQVGAVVAESFARIFYRNALNLGLPVIVCQKASAELRNGDKIIIDLENGTITDCVTNKIVSCEKLTNYALEILSAGGIKPLIKRKLLTESAE